MNPHVKERALTVTESYSGTERRARTRSDGIELRRRQRQEVEDDRRRKRQDGFDIAAALELYLDQVKTRRAMKELLESWLSDARGSGADTQDEDYVQAVRHAIEVVGASPDPQTAIAVLQRR